MSAKNRYQKYGYPSMSSSTSNTSIASSCVSEADRRSSLSVHECQSNGGTLPRTNGMKESNGRSYRSRLEYIVSSMAYIRGELDDLKESDRVLLDIFKQLEANVEELNENISSWRMSGSFAARPSSYTEVDFQRLSPSSNSRRPPHLDSRGHDSYGHSTGGLSYTTNGLETILDSSKEDVASLKEENETDSGLIPDSSSMSCSPVLHNAPKLPHHCSLSSIRGSGGGALTASKRSSDVSPQMRLSTSFNRLANSPSISRLQDDSGSTMSRNSSIDSGIQFASEAENCSTNSVVEPPVAPALVVPSPEDIRKSVGFADDIFAALGMK